jgi:hypothetical protein
MNLIRFGYYHEYKVLDSILASCSASRAEKCALGLDCLPDLFGCHPEPFLCSS